MQNYTHENIHIIEGTKPILISAPHAVPIKRIDDQGEIYIKPQESMVVDIVKELCEKRGAWGIFTKTDSGVLEGWDEKIYKEYKALVKNIVKEQGAQLFIDIHGAHESRPFLIDYDFKLRNIHPYDTHIEKILTKHFLKYFSADSLSTKFFQTKNGPGKKTLTYYVRKNFSIPAIQLELNYSARKQRGDFIKLIDITQSLIRDYENSFIGFSKKRN